MDEMSQLLIPFPDQEAVPIPAVADGLTRTMAMLLLQVLAVEVAEQERQAGDGDDR